MSIKVLVTGPFSTGKTETVTDLAERIHAEHRRVTVVPDVARACPLPLNEEQTDDASLWLAMTQIAWEVQASAGVNDVVLCDRGIPDILAHSDDAHGTAPIQDLETLRPFLLQWCATYDVILASEVDESVLIAPDGLRSHSSEYRRRLGMRSRAVLAALGISYTLPFGRSERLAYALAAMQPLLDARAGSR